MKQVFSENGLSVYADGLFSLPEDSSSVIVRCWNKDALGLELLFRHLSDVRSYFNFDRLILSIDFEFDNGTTVSELAKVAAPFPVIPLEVYGPPGKNWTRLLNAPLLYLYRCGVRYGKVLNLSYDARIDLSSFEEAMASLQDSDLAAPCISARRTPDHLLSFGEIQFLANLGSGIVRHFLNRITEYIRHGRGNIETWDHYLKFLWRNTAMVWDFASLIELGGFDPRCNETGGQEELAMICALIRAKGFMPGNAVGTDTIFWYDDPTLLGDVAKQKTKIANEEASTRAILELYRRLPNYTPDFVFQS